MPPTNPPALFPLFADLRGRRVLVVGGGSVAKRKVEALLAAGARVAVGAPDLEPELAAWKTSARIEHHEGRFTPSWLDDAWLVIAATDDPVTNRAVVEAADARRIFANAVDDAELSRFHVPARAMTLDMVINLLLVFFVGNVLAIYVVGNLGYILAHVFALSAFVLLRRDRPNWPRPIKLSRIWVAIAALLAAANLFLTVMGVWYTELIGYGGTKEILYGVGVLLISVLLFFFRRIVQDGEKPHWREETPTMPPTSSAGA